MIRKFPKNNKLASKGNAALPPHKWMINMYSFQNRPVTCFFVVGLLLSSVTMAIFVRFTNFWTDVLTSYSPSVAGVFSAYLV